MARIGDAPQLTTLLAIDILRTHPMVIIGGVLVENTFSPVQTILFARCSRGPRQHRVTGGNLGARQEGKVRPLTVARFVDPNAH
jgi:hypothetical protein